MRGDLTRLCLAGWLFALSISADAAPVDGRDPELFRQWAASHDVGPFQRSLAAKGLQDVAPLYQLLRTASDWQRCGAEPFAIPPEQQWPAVESTLELLKKLKAHGTLPRFEILSAYRSPALNRCANGAPSSAHARAFAVDLDLGEETESAARLCDFWKREGQRWNMGLSRYPSGRIHIDTAGYRTWGEDHTCNTSFCLEPRNRR